MIINSMITNMERYLHSIFSKDNKQVAFVMPPDFDTNSYKEIPDENKLTYCKSACSGIFIGTNSPIYKEILNFITDYGKAEVEILPEALEMHRNDDYKVLKDVTIDGRTLYYVKKTETGNSYPISKKAIQLLGFKVD